MATFDSGIFDGAIFDTDETVVVDIDAAFTLGLVSGITAQPIAVGSIDAIFGPALVSGITVAPVARFDFATVFPLGLVSGITGESDGTPIVIPRSIAGGIAYLVEIEARRQSGDFLTLTYSSDGFRSRPDDPLPNRVYTERVINAGHYSRSLFGSGTTSGQSSVGVGYIELNDNDGRLSDGGADSIDDLAFDGYSLTVRTVSRTRPRYDNSVVVFRGTMEQAEFVWGMVRIRIRERLALLNEPVQEDRYAGTTTAGGMDEAEGRPEDLKGQPKPLAFGRLLNVPAVPSNVFDGIYDLSETALGSVAAVRDRGVMLTPSGNDHATIAALRTASIPVGQWASALTLGKIRVGGTPAGQVTAAPVSGASAGERTAAQLARQVMLRMGLVEDTDFLAEDVGALDAINDAEIGYWTGTQEETALSVLSKILGSIGATICPDRLGVFRLYRLDDPEGVIPVTTITEMEVLEQAGARLERLATGDQGRGVPAWQVTQNYAWNGAVMSANDLAVGTLPLTDSFRAFAGQEWRSAVASDEAVQDIHRLASDLSFESFLVDAAAADAEAERRLALYGVRRDRFRVPVKSYLVEQVDLNAVVRLRLPRFNLQSGKLFRVIGMEEDFSRDLTTLDLWG